MAKKEVRSKKKTSNTNKKKNITKKRQKEIDRRWSIVMFGLGAVITAMSFIQGENFWLFLRDNFLFGVFGFSAYILGPSIIYLGALTYSEKPVRLKMLFGVFLLLLTSGLVHIFKVQTVPATGFKDTVVSLFKLAKADHISGGAIAVFAAILQVLMGDIAAKILLIILTLIFLMFFTDTTPRDIVLKFKAKAAREKQQLSQELVARREEREEKAQMAQQQFRQRQLKERKHRNIDIDIGNDISAANLIDTTKDDNVKTVDYFEDGAVDVEGKVAYTFDRIKERKSKSDLEKITRQLDKSADRGDAQTEYNLNRSKDLTDKALSNIKDIRQGKNPAKHIVASDENSNIVDTTAVYDSNDNNKYNTATQAEKQPTDVKNSTENEIRPKVYIYRHPPLDLYDADMQSSGAGIEEELRQNATKLVSTLDSFGVKTKLIDYSRGPAVTRYELQPEMGVKISKITGLADDIALNLAASGVRIEAPIPGKAAVGVEIPNKKKASVPIRRILSSKQFRDSKSPLTMALGVDIEGKVVTADLRKMPHLLVAGSTGSGKSVCVNATIISFIFKSSPEDVKMILIDPKVVELAEYNGIPHLLMPVVTDAKKAAGALGGAVAEMEKRYRLFADYSVRNIESYNEMVKSKTPQELEESGMKKMPYIAIIIDELADLMMAAGKEVEDSICRLRQKARAAGIHLIVATQRPSVDVITGLIKANIPSRISFAVSSQVDSRTILDGSGAEKLLGMGDMLFLPVGASKPVRVQGTYVKDHEIEKTIEFVKQNRRAEYDQELIDKMEELSENVGQKGSGAGNVDSDRDQMTDKAIETVIEAGQASTSLLQRKLRLGYARAARIMDEMEEMGIIGPFQGSKPREVLITRAQWQEMMLTKNE